MAKLALSDAGLRSLAPPAKGQCCYWDERLPTFGVRVSQGGSKTFILNRGNTLITLGRFPVLSLSEARTEAKRLLAEFTLGRTRPQSLSYASAVEQFIGEKTKNRRTKTTYEYERMLSQLRFVDPVGSITPPEVARQLAKIKSPSAYDHYLIALRVFFNWCIKRQLRTDNPTLGLSSHKKKSRKRVLADEELKDIWLAAQQVGGHYGTVVRLLVVTGQRRGEIAALRTSHVEGDVVTLPAELVKNGREHAFPLTSIARALLRETEVSIKSNDAVFFPAHGKTDKPLNSWSKSIKLLRKELGPHFKHFTLHDLRRTYRSNLGRVGVPPYIAERLVNHVSSRSEMDIVYDQYTYLPEMRDAVERFEAWFTRLIE